MGLLHWIENTALGVWHLPGHAINVVQDWDYGTVPQWISSASVPAALYIILRDRKKGALEQANQLICWSDQAVQEETENGVLVRVEVHAENTSNAPVRRVRAGVLVRNDAATGPMSRFTHLDFDSSPAGVRQEHGGETITVLPAGHTAQFIAHYQTSTAALLPFSQADVFFYDATGQSCGRDLTSGKLFVHRGRAKQL